MANYEVIVVGAGHAGIEAALASARMGVKTLLLTMNADQIGAMSCNPAIGGLGKSQLAKEIDALGGWMCRAADRTAMQYRLLNESKGPAVRATRVQVDRHEYRQVMKAKVEREPNLSVKQGQAVRLLFEGEKLSGIETTLGQKLFGRQIIITTGTFMNGKAHVGKVNFSSGRAGEPPSIGLSDYLASVGIKVGRLKTGTVPRLDARSIDFSKTEKQESQTHCGPLSVFSKNLRSDLQCAHITYTNELTHEIIRSSLEDSPLYSGIISSRGPRYCPSVEDKVVRFADKNRHQVFLEREGRETEEVYAAGLSTSLPYECQLRFLRSIPGLENVEIIRPGYAIEYDYIDATQLYPTLESKDIPGLFFAGQVNGTSGYEEAGAQGIFAGINAACKAKGLEPFLLTRGESYIAVMVDDLVTKGTKEPYRMFTSRAEWRLLLRQDNADERLIEKARRLNLVTESEFESYWNRKQMRENLRAQLFEMKFTPTEATNQKLESLGHTPLKTLARAPDLLRRPGFVMKTLESLSNRDFHSEFLDDDLSFVETEIKYEGYIRQAQNQIRQLEKSEQMKIPIDLDFKLVPGLTVEAVEKLSAVKPRSLGQAGRISGITAATISILAIYLSRKSKKLLTNENHSCILSKDFDLIERPEQDSVGNEATK